MTQLANATDFSQTMRSIIVRDTMTTGVLTVYEGWSIRRLSKFFENHGVSGAPVIASDDELVGVVSQSDIIGFEARKPKEDEVKKIVERFCGHITRELDKFEIERIQDQALNYMTVNDIMTDAPITIDVNATLEDAYMLLKETQVHRLLVVDAGILVGVLTAMDILEQLH